MALNHLPKVSRGLFIVLASLLSFDSFAASVKPMITLDPVAGRSAVTPSPLREQSSRIPANFRHLGDLTIGQTANVEPLTLRFAVETKLLTIKSTPDFAIESGGSCIEGNAYPANGTCRLLVRFTPQGPGHRVGKLTINHTASATPDYVGLGGNGYAPTVSFTPALITTVPASIAAGVGVLNNAQNLAVDGGDTLYIADTGNNLARSYDSGGKFTSLGSGLSAPVGIAADSYGYVYVSEPSSQNIFGIYYGGEVSALSANSGNDDCTVAAPCTLGNEALANPGAMAMDSENRLFFENRFHTVFEGVGVATLYPTAGNQTLADLFAPYAYFGATKPAFAIDQSDNLYTQTSYDVYAVCQIEMQSYYYAAYDIRGGTKVAGGNLCGFSGDGGPARNAEIGKTIGQIAFDIAGNLYFTDASNYRVRRIDASTGIIRTIAGNGTQGNSGDNGQATSATLNAPTGIAVDSQGQVYVINRSATTGTKQVIRKLGPNGIDTFGSVLKGASLSKLVNMANTGNSALNITHMVFTGANPRDFSLDATTTSCDFTAGNSLAAGQSCQVGIVFKPSTSGARSANLVLLDNSATNSNVIQLTGTGTLPAATVKTTAPTPGATFTSGATVKFTATVTASGTAPTGNVTFKVDGHASGNPVALASGSASVNLTGLTVNPHSLTATYNGDANYAATTVSESIVVKAPAATSPHPIGRPVNIN